MQLVDVLDDAFVLIVDDIYAHAQVRGPGQQLRHVNLR
jgi:hypothetical protein